MQWQTCRIRPGSGLIHISTSGRLSAKTCRPLHGSPRADLPVVAQVAALVRVQECQIEAHAVRGQVLQRLVRRPHNDIYLCMRVRILIEHYCARMCINSLGMYISAAGPVH